MSQERSGKRRLRVWAVLGLAAIVLLGTQEQWRPLFANAPASLTKDATAGPAKKPKGVPVITRTVEERLDTVIIEAIGTARAARSVVLFPEAEGKVVDMPAHTGDVVDKGAVILRLENRNELLAVKVATTHVKNAERELQRAKDLRAKNVKSSANVEDAELILERAKLELSQAREALADRTLRAPFAGVVGIPKVEAGDRITSDTEVISLDDRATLLVEFEVAERFFARLNEGLTVNAQTPTFAETVIVGTIDRIDSRIDPVARTVMLRAAFPNTRDDLRPGMSFAVSLTLPGPMLPAVPELALQWRDGKSFVWRIKDGKAEQVVVTAARRLNETVLVNGDISPGDTVVVEGVQRLRAGVSVYQSTPPDT